MCVSGPLQRESFKKQTVAHQSIQVQLSGQAPSQPKTNRRRVQEKVSNLGHPAGVDVMLFCLHGGLREFPFEANKAVALLTEGTAPHIRSPAKTTAHRAGQASGPERRPFGMCQFQGNVGLWVVGQKYHCCAWDSTGTVSER